MFRNILLYVKYPSVAGIIGAIWVGSGIMMITHSSLPVLSMIVLNIVVSLCIGLIGFRVDKK